MVVLRVYLTGVGLRMAAAGHRIDRNYLHAPASSVVAVAIGVVLVVVGIFVRR